MIIAKTVDRGKEQRLSEQSLEKIVDKTLNDIGNLSADLLLLSEYGRLSEGLYLEMSMTLQRLEYRMKQYKEIEHGHR